MFSNHRALSVAIARLLAYIEREQYSCEYENAREFEAVTAKHPVHRGICRVQERCFGGSPLPPELCTLWTAFLKSTRQKLPEGLPPEEELAFWTDRQSQIQATGKRFLESLTALAPALADDAAPALADGAAPTQAGRSALALALDSPAASTVPASHKKMRLGEGKPARIAWSRLIGFKELREKLGIAQSTLRRRLVTTGQAVPGKIRVLRPTPSSRIVQVALADLPGAVRRWLKFGK